MQSRPKMKIPLTLVDKVLETVCLTLLLLLWMGTIVSFSYLPDEIPSHFQATGEADAFSNKATVFILPVVSTVIYLGMTLLSKYPHFYNYPTTVTPENAQRLYTSATRLIRVLKLVVVAIFSAIVLMTCKTAFKPGSGLGRWFLPLAVGLLIIPNVIYLLKLSGIRKR